MAELSAKVASAANIDAHARIVLEKALSRQLIKTASDIIERAADAVIFIYRPDIYGIRVATGTSLERAHRDNNRQAAQRSP